jgi:hypothetical protein
MTMTMTIQATTCPPWCELDDHADWADRIRIQHRANRAIPISALPVRRPRAGAGSRGIDRVPARVGRIRAYVPSREPSMPCGT